MIKTNPYQSRIHIFHVTDGKLWTFKHEREACRYTRSIQALGDVGSHFKEFSHCTPMWDCDRKLYTYHPHYNHHDVILRDDCSEIVSIYHLIRLWNQRFQKPYRSYFRVPGTKRSSYGKYFRNVQTTNERRQAVDNWDAYDDYGVVVRPRGSRGYHGLPNSWDDYHRHTTNSWKKHRKTQWR